MHVFLLDVDFFLKQIILLKYVQWLLGDSEISNIHNLRGKYREAMKR